MRRASAAYERELKQLLQADEAALAAFGRSLTAPERVALDRLARTPLLVIRGAGSLGFDLVALRSDFAFAVEVKASAFEQILFSAAGGRAGVQLTAHRRAVDRVGVMVVYAYRRVGGRSGDPWRLFLGSRRVETGRVRLFTNRLPPVESTRDGHAVLRWANGMPLLTFLELLADSLRPPTREIVA